MTRALVAFIVASLLLTQVAGQSPAAPQTQPRRRYLTFPVTVSVATVPALTEGDDGQLYTAYHLFLTNWSYSDLTLQSVAVRDDKGRDLLRYGAEDLADPYRMQWIPARRGAVDASNPRTLQSGRQAVLFFWLKTDRSKPILGVQHRFVFESSDAIQFVGAPASAPGAAPVPLVFDSKVVPLDTSVTPVIGAPLRGGPWRCGNGPGLRSDHQGIAYWDGLAYNGQRFGYDFSKIDARGEVLKPGTTLETLANTSFYGYGEDVLSVSDGEIVFVQDGIPENVPLVTGEIKPPVPLTWETLPGNWISLKFGDGWYAYYAHLQPGSIRYKAGDHVTRGAVLAKLGNAGNTVGPHLHFSIGRTVSLNGGDGFPQMFDHFLLHGHLGSTWNADSSNSAVRQMPMLGAVVTFDR
jgi:hypothetical protein